MSNKERLAFEATLKQDTKLQKQLEEVKGLFLDIETAGLVDQLDTFHTNLPKPGPLKKTTRVLRLSNSQLAVAASITLLIGLGTWWLLNNSPDHERLYEEYYRKPIGLPVIMGDNENFDFLDAMVNYKMGEYDEAIQKWQTLQQIDVENDTLNYFLGAAFLELEEPQKAISFLQRAANKDHSSFQNKAQLYLGFALLKLNRLNEAERWFIKSETPLGDEILAQLKKVIKDNHD